MTKILRTLFPAFYPALLLATSSFIAPSLASPAAAVATDKSGSVSLASDAAPAFTLPDLFQDRSLTLHELQGKVVLVDFWASWCPPCRKTLPELGHIRARHPSAVVLALSIDEEKGKAQRFLKPRDASLIYLHDAKRKVAEQYNLGGMPSAYLIDRKGNLRFRHDGYGESDLRKIEEEMGKLLEEKP